MLTSVVLMLLACCTLTQGIIDSGDPCVVNVNLHRPGERGTGCVIRDNQVCDLDLEREWYLVQVGGVNLQMVEEVPELDNSCGTSFPIWMNGTHPTVNRTSENVTGCMAIPGDPCALTFDVRVLNCGEYFVYLLPKTDACNTAYCFGQGRPCVVDGSGYDNGGSRQDPLPITVLMLMCLSWKWLIIGPSA